MSAQQTTQLMRGRLKGHELPRGQELGTVDILEFELVHPSSQSASLRGEISNFLDTQDTSHPFQLPQWSERAHVALLRRRGHIQWFAQCCVLYPAGRILPCIRALTVNRGPVCDDLELLEAGLLQLVAESRKRGIAYIDIAPEWTGPFAELAVSVLERNGWRASPATRSSLRLDLRPALDPLLAGFRKTTRYEIRRAEHQGMKVMSGLNESDFRAFLLLYVAMASRKQFHPENVEFLLHVIRWLAADPERGALLLACDGEDLKGGVVIVRAGVRCWYLVGATSKEGKVSAGYLLQWRAIQWAKEKGCLEYDFGGFREGMSSGPAHFKRGFCDRVVHLAAPHRYIVNQNRCALADLILSLRSKFWRLRRSAASRSSLRR